MTGVGGMTQLGGLMQIARRGTGSSAEMSTALGQALTQMQLKSPDIQSGAASVSLSAGQFSLIPASLERTEILASSEAVLLCVRAG
jgi:hypothetical protein